MSSTRQSASSGSPAFAIPSLRAATIALFERIASLPPRSMQAFPLLRARAAASDVTLGRLSYIIARSPSGTDTFVIRSPLGRIISSSTLPTGSSRDAALRMDCAMPSMRFSSSASLSIITSEMLPRAAATSSRFAAIISPVCAARLSAIYISALFFVSVSAIATALLVAAARFISSAVVIYKSPYFRFFRGKAPRRLFCPVLFSVEFCTYGL